MEDTYTQKGLHTVGHKQGRSYTRRRHTHGRTWDIHTEVTYSRKGPTYKRTHTNKMHMDGYTGGGDIHK